MPMMMGQDGAYHLAPGAEHILMQQSSSSGGSPPVSPGEFVCVCVQVRQ